MPLHSGISKKLRAAFRNTGFVVLVALLLAVVYGYKLLLQYSETYSVEWAGEADSVILRFNKADALSGRIIFVSHTPFGKRMIDQYLVSFQATNPGAIIKQGPFFSVIGGTPDSLVAHYYLNYLAFAKLKFAHGRRLLFSHAHSVTSTAATAESDLYLQALFTRGLYKSPDNALVKQLQFLIQHAEPGSDIRISVFLFFYENENEPLLLDLLAAAARGVNVQLITDLPEADKPARRGIGHAFQENFVKRMQAAAIKGRSDSWIKNHAAVGWRSKNHTKIFLFSHSAGKRKWLIVSSENLTDTERQKYQAGLVVRDSVSYDAFNEYWQQILDGSYRDLWSASNGKSLTHYFFPQTTSEDEIYRQLDLIMKSLDSSRPGKLSISMAQWNFERFPLAMKLVQIAERGVNVEIVTRKNPYVVDGTILHALSHSPNITLHTADVDRLNIHSKYMLYEGFYRGQHSKILWVGSHNFTGMAMRNNYETWTEVRDDKIFHEFSDNFAELKSLVPVDPSSGSIK